MQHSRTACLHTLHSCLCGVYAKFRKPLSQRSRVLTSICSPSGLVQPRTYIDTPGHFHKISNSTKFYNITASVRARTLESIFREYEIFSENSERTDRAVTEIAWISSFVTCWKISETPCIFNETLETSQLCKFFLTKMNETIIHVCLYISRMK